MLSPGPRARAQEGGEKLRLGAAMVIDFAGSVERDPPARLNSLRSSARVTPGFRLHADYDVHRHVSVGGLLRFGFWRSERQDSDRNMLVDLVARVNGHYDWRDFRFYGVFMIGPTFNRLHADNIAGLDNPTQLMPGVAVVADSTYAAFKGRDMGTDQPCLAALDAGVGFGQVGAPGSDALDLGAGQDQPSLQRLLDVVFVAGATVL